MTPSRLESAQRALNSVARKVYDHVPVESAAMLHEISASLRKDGLAYEMPVVQGSVHRLLDDGLIVEDTAGRYRRVVARPRAALAAVQEPQDAQAAPADDAPPPTPRTPLDVLVALSERAKALAAELQRFAAEIDDAGIEVGQLFAQAGRDSERLRQLQALLKG